MEFHEVANIFPMMGEDEFNALVTDIKAHGLREPVWTYQGKIIDGRNRYKACRDAGIEPQFREWTGEESGLLSFVLSLNLQRRHLSSSQKAILAVEIEKYLAKDAELRMKAGKKIDDPVQKFAQGKASSQAASLVGTNRQYVLDAKKVVETAPDLGEAVRRGEISIPDTKLIMKMSAAQRQAVLAHIEHVNTDIWPNRVKRAIELVTKEAQEEEQERRLAEYERQRKDLLARQSTPEYKRQEEERRKHVEELQRQEEERRKAAADQASAHAQEIRRTLNAPISEEHRAAIYEAAREVNTHMKQAALAYTQFLARFHDLAGWVDSDRLQPPPEDWRRQISAHNYVAQNMGPDLTSKNIVHLYLNFQLEGGGGSFSLRLIDIDDLQQWIDEPHGEERGER